eukprot:jgi/Ulvmu1/10151/UM006_0105.1
MLNLLKGAVAATALSAVSHQAYAQNTANCFVSASSSGAQVTEGTFIAGIVVEVAQSVCDGVIDRTIVEETLGRFAEAVAEAVTNVTSACYANGNAAFTINGYSLAEYSARSVLKTSADVIVSSEVCQNCTAFATVVVEDVVEIIASAVAKSEVSLSGSTQTGDDPITVRAEDFKKDVARTAVEGFAESESFFPAIEGSRAACGVAINASATNNLTNTIAQCNITAAGAVQATIENFVASALTPVITIPCDVPQTFDGSSLATALSNAGARAAAQVVGECTSTGATSAACAQASVEARAIAEATAEVFAQGYRVISEGCIPPIPDNCLFGVDATESAIADVLSTALASALADGCQEGVGITNFLALQVDVQNRAVEAIATVITNVTIEQNVCTRLNEDTVNATAGEVPSTITPVPPVVITDDVRDDIPPSPIVPPLLNEPPLAPPNPPATSTRPDNVPLSPPAVIPPGGCARSCSRSRCASLLNKEVTPCCGRQLCARFGPNSGICRDPEEVGNFEVLQCTPAA